MNNFNVVYRNPGHWDIYSEKKRIFKIRGENGDVVVDNQIIGYRFSVRTIGVGMALICDKLMFEK